MLISSYEYSDEMAESLNDFGMEENKDYYTFGTLAKLVEDNMVY